MLERIGKRKELTAASLACVGMLGIAGCSSHDTTTTARFAVTCPDNLQPDYATPKQVDQDDYTLEVTCSDESDEAKPPKFLNQINDDRRAPHEIDIVYQYSKDVKSQMVEVDDRSGMIYLHGASAILGVCNVAHPAEDFTCPESLND